MSALIGDVTRETADGIILAYPLPDAVIGTRERDGDDWCVGTERDPRHCHWLARTGGRRKDREIVVRFDPVVDVGGTRLGPSDALTKKLLVLAWLAGTLLRPRANARRLRVLANTFDWLVRHRLSVGVTCNSNLGRQHFRDFMERAKTGSLLDLVPVGRRMESAASAVAGDDPPVVGESDHHTDGNGALPRLAVLAKRLGVTGQSLWRRADPKDAREHLGGGECRLLGRPGANERLGDRGPVPAPNYPGMNRRGLQVVLTVWEDVWALSRRGALAHDPLPFDPLEGTTASKHAERHGKPMTGSDAVCPAALMAWLVAAAEVAATWAGPTIAAVERYRSERLDDPAADNATTKARRLELSKNMDSELPGGMPGLWLAWHGHPRSDPGMGGRRNLAEAVYHVMTACFLLIATFAACGVDDVLDLSADSLTEPSKGQFELVVRRDASMRPRRAVPIPNIAAIAFRVLIRLTQATREAKGGESLFSVAWCLAGGVDRPTRRLRFPHGRYLSKFASAHDLPSLDRADLRPVTGDQFKVGFALAFVYAVPGATMEELCAFLGSGYPEQVRKYVHGTLPGRVAALRARIANQIQQARESAGWDQATELQMDRQLLVEHEATRAAVNDALSQDFIERAMRIVDRSDIPGGRGGAVLVRDVDKAVARVRADLVLGACNDPDHEMLPFPG